MDDGTYYVFPAVYADRELAVSDGPTIRYDWFKKLGIEKKPTTIADWADMLRKVRSTDLNGNGAGDIQGIFIQAKEKLDTRPFLIGAWGIRQEFYNDNGTVKFGGIQPQYKAGCADIVQPDNRRAGGVTEWMDIASISEAAGLKLASHGGGPGNVNVLCAMENIMLKTQLTMKNGAIPFPETPGMGADVQEAISATTS